MFYQLIEWGKRLFPDRQVLVRAEGRVTYITLTRGVQVTAAVGFLMAVVTIGYVTARYVHFGKVVAANRVEVIEAETSNASLRKTITDLKDQLLSANVQLDAVQSNLSSIGMQYGELTGSITNTEQQLKDNAAARTRLEAERTDLEKRLNAAQSTANAKAGQAAQLAKNLEESKSELLATEEQRGSLVSRIRELENELQAANTHASDFKANLDATQKKLDGVTSERDKAAADQDQLAARRDALKTQIHNIEGHLVNPDSQDPADESDTGAQAGDSKDVEGEVGTDLLETAPAVKHPARPISGSISFSGIEGVVASTGLDVEDMLVRFDSHRNEGGPYIALGTKSQSPQEQAEREATLRKLLRTLPLQAPLAQYQVESPFGARIDPINHRRGFHPGIDLAAPFRSPVYSTAPGTVSYTGTLGDYGKVVEIDHGMGIITRYAHLHRIMVAKGQRLGVHQQIGQLGSTGRTTGPHVHYEVRVDGEPLDPEKFMEAGKNVVQVSGQ